MIKLVAIDIDDTLINNRQEITIDNLMAITKTRAKDIRVILATGRMHVATMPFVRQLEIPATEMVISYNGAMIRQANGTLIDHIALDQKVALRVIEYCKTYDLTLNAYYDDRLYVQNIDNNVKKYCEMVKVEANRVDDLASFITRGEKPLSKMLIIGDDSDIAERLPKLQKIFNGIAQVTRSKSNFIEITHPNATKGQALARLAQKMDLKAEQVMAIGDSGNDLTMIQYAGIGVAMGNASLEIQEAADYVTASNEKSGVAKALHRFILE